MANEKKRQSLGRGLGALLSTGSGVGKSSITSSFVKSDSSEKVLMLPIEQIVRDSEQPRENFDELELATLAASIHENGLIQPIIVRREGEQYKIIAGERRWRATQIAGEKEIAAIVREVGQEQSAVLALVENLHRSNLNPIEEALAYRQLIDEFRNPALIVDVAVTPGHEAVQLPVVRGLRIGQKTARIPDVGEELRALQPEEEEPGQPVLITAAEDQKVLPRKIRQQVLRLGGGIHPPA